MKFLHVALSIHALLLSLGSATPTNKATEPKPAAQTRMQKITSMYGFEGFVYALDQCPTSSNLVSDFSQMKAKGARTVITFDYCGTGDDASYYEKFFFSLMGILAVIQAAGQVGINIIPLAWTLLLDSSQTFQNTSVPKIQAVTKAVLANPDPVLAVALGDEPLYDNDAGSADNLAKYVVQMKATFTDAGLNIPVSISELAYGWQISGDITNLANAVDFFMINNFPYFAFDAESGGSATSWSDFTNDISYYESIANGKPLLVTQTGWPSNEELWSPNSAAVVASVPSEEAYWKLLDSHCADFFKAKNIGWMWRSWNDVLTGWGARYSNGTQKWNFSAKTTC